VGAGGYPILAPSVAAFVEQHAIMEDKTFSIYQKRTFFVGVPR